MQPKDAPSLVLKEAEELYNLLGISEVREESYGVYEKYHLYPLQVEDPNQIDKIEKLTWTRLSINSNNLSIIE